MKQRNKKHRERPGVTVGEMDPFQLPLLYFYSKEKGVFLHICPLNLLGVDNLPLKFLILIIYTFNLEKVAAIVSNFLWFFARLRDWTLKKLKD